MSSNKVISELAGLGRLRQWDHRNLNHPMPQLATSVRRRMWHSGPVLDQGDTPQCVGYAGYGWLQAGPVVNKPKFSPTDLYHWAQENDEWEGSNYDGSSTLGLMKSLKTKGYIDQYVWATEAQTLIDWVLERSPVIVGTNWYMSMFTPLVLNDFLTIEGEVAGGHEWWIVGADLDRLCPDGSHGAARMVNSWGRGWSDNGRAWISIKDLDRLIQEDGEAVTAVELRL